MSKQKIEVGQVWQYFGRAETVTVVGVSPAWIRVQYEDDSEGSIRRGELAAKLCLRYEADTAVPTIIEVETPADPDFSEVSVAIDYDPSSRSIAISHAAVAAFNAQTDMDMQAADVFLLLHNLAIVQGRTDDGPELVRTDVDFLALYEEAR